MQKSWLVLIILALCGMCGYPAKGEEIAAMPHEQTYGELEVGRIMHGEIKRQSLEASEDDLYSGSDIVPLDKEMSLEERAQPQSTDVYYIDRQDMPPELMCDNEKLHRQVVSFLDANLKAGFSDSVLQKRARVLLLRNLQPFSEIAAEEIDGKNYELSASLAYLKINKKRESYKICISKNNQYDDYPKFNDVIIIIYPFANFYKIVVTNLLDKPEKIDDATFIYNW